MGKYSHFEPDETQTGGPQCGVPSGGSGEIGSQVPGEIKCGNFGVSHAVSHSTLSLAL